MVDENQELQEGVDNPEEAIERMEKSYEARYGKSSYAFHEEIAIKSREKLVVNIKNDYIEVIKKNEGSITFYVNTSNESVEGTVASVIKEQHIIDTR